MYFCELVWLVQRGFFTGAFIQIPKLIPVWETFVSPHILLGPFGLENKDVRSAQKERKEAQLQMYNCPIDVF